MSVDTILQYLFCCRDIGTDDTFEMSGRELVEGETHRNESERLLILLGYLHNETLNVVQIRDTVITKNSQNMEALQCPRKHSAL